MAEYAEKSVINDNSLLNVITEIESELEILPGTINDLQGRLSPVLKPEQDSLATETKESDIRSISNNSVTYDRLIEVLRRLQSTKVRIHEITDRVQL